MLFYQHKLQLLPWKLESEWIESNYDVLTDDLGWNKIEAFQEMSSQTTQNTH